MQFEFCVGLSGKSSGADIGAGVRSLGAMNGHALLLSSCESLLGQETAGDDVGMGWVNFCFEVGFILPESSLESYVAQNLFRHLWAASVGEVGDGVSMLVLSVLADFRMLRGRIACHGRNSVGWDLWHARNSHVMDGETASCIGAVWDCLMHVADNVSIGKDGTLAGCLVQLAQSYLDSGDAGMGSFPFRKLVNSIASDVHGPWFKPIGGCSRTRDQHVLVEACVGNDNRVFSLASLGDGEHFISGSL